MTDQCDQDQTDQCDQDQTLLTQELSLGLSARAALSLQRGEILQKMSPSQNNEFQHIFITQYLL